MNAMLLFQTPYIRWSAELAAPVERCPTCSPRLIVPSPAIIYRLARTLKGLSSAALYESNANKLTKYSAANLTTKSLSPPFPSNILCRLANGLSPTGRLGSEAEPSVRPLVWKTAEAAPGPDVSLAALRTAAVRAAGLAPRMVSTTDEDLMMRKVGILHDRH